MIGCALAAALGALLLPVEGEAALRQSAYFRIAVSPEYTIYGLVWDDMLFLAADPGKLADADPVRAEDVERVALDNGARIVMHRFPAAVLPFPAEALPRGTTQAVVSLVHNSFSSAAPAATRRTSSFVYGLAGWGGKDGDGREWRYWRSVWLDSGTRPQTAPMLALPPAGPLALKASTRALEKRTIGIGVQLMAGETEVQQVTRDGENAPIRLRVLDAGGEEVSAKEGNLVEFGFT